MRVLDLFAGIGGFSLGLERSGFQTVAFCEIDPYCRKVLAKHWPEVPIYEDVKKLTAERLARNGIEVDVLTGGFPCQDISVAGKRAGIGEGTRSGLWSEVARLISELRPRYAVMENVTALLSGDSGRWFGRVLGDLAEIGYDAEWHCIPASHVGAHHRRDRVWIVAYPNGNGESGRAVNAGAVCEAAFLADASSQRWEGGAQARGNGENGSKPREQLLTRCRGVQGAIWEAEPNVGRVADGVPNRSHRLRALGNAVVPQIPELIGRAVLAQEDF